MGRCTFYSLARSNQKDVITKSRDLQGMEVEPEVKEEVKPKKTKATKKEAK